MIYVKIFWVCVDFILSWIFPTGDSSCDCSSSFTEGIGIGVGVVLGLELIVFLLVLGIVYYRSSHPRTLNFEKDRERNSSPKLKFDSLGFTTVDKKSKMPEEAINTDSETRENAAIKDSGYSQFAHPGTNSKNEHKTYPHSALSEPDSKKKLSTLPLSDYVSPRSSKDHAIMGDLGAGSGFWTLCICSYLLIFVYLKLVVYVFMISWFFCQTLTFYFDWVWFWQNQSQCICDFQWKHILNELPLLVNVCIFVVYNMVC